MSWKTAGITWIALLAVGFGVPTMADDRRGGEVGVLIGAMTPDEEMTGDSSSAELTIGLRGGAVFSHRWGWFIDGLYTEIGTTQGLGDATTVIGRSGFDLLFTPQRNARWLVSFGAGWMVVDYDNAGPQDFHNPIASLGFGQRIRLGGNTRLRWELRGDHTLDDARLNDPLVQGHALLGLVWGPGGEGGSSARAAAFDDDGDGVRDKRDRCPETPRGAVVDAQGCTLDGDRDGVPDGVDRCPHSRSDEDAGPDGCPADADGDGVSDRGDVCARTPSQAQVDEWGCPADSDSDTVYDGLDDCPATPVGARVDAQGCPSDADGDGVFDGLDRCPRTPAGASVDSRGCYFDGDEDGVHDEIDECPDTPLDTRAVDARGCAIRAALFEPDRTTLILSGVHFDSNSATLPPDSRGRLDGVALSLREQPEIRVVIGGHTDAAGDEEANLRLSERRAQAVRVYLIERGIRADRLVARGYGESRPVADNATAEGRARNRRVELEQVE